MNDSSGNRKSPAIVQLHFIFINQGNRLMKWFIEKVHQHKHAFHLKLLFEKKWYANNLSAIRIINSSFVFFISIDRPTIIGSSKISIPFGLSHQFSPETFVCCALRFPFFYKYVYNCNKFTSHTSANKFHGIAPTFQT